MTTFYAAFAPLSFTVLGLWFVVVQTRHREWFASPHHRRQATAVSLQLALPGLMSLLSLVAPTSKVMWRVSFTLVAIVGAAGLVALLVSRPAGSAMSPPTLVARLIGVVLFVFVGIVATAPQLVHDAGLAASGLQVEAVFVSLLVFSGMSVAWLLMFEEIPDSDAVDGTRND